MINYNHVLHIRSMYKIDRRGGEGGVVHNFGVSCSLGNLKPKLESNIGLPVPQFYGFYY